MKLHYNTVSEQLLEILKHLMQAAIFAPFRLVGGTALSLYKGHRMSIDIDLFSDAPYNSIDFDAIDAFLNNHFPYVDSLKIKPIGIGKSYFVGKSKDNCIKLDVFYTDDFVYDVQIIDGLRIASVEEIIAMKLEVVEHIGRKKDFWDIHSFITEYSLLEMLAFHKKRYPYSHDAETIISNFTNFERADTDFDPICLEHKRWEIIKLDLMDFAKLHS